MSKVALYQNWGRDNDELVRYTIGNHLRYSAKWGYDYFLEHDSEYDVFPKLDKIAHLLTTHQTVITIGADCLFTNFNRNLAEYSNNYLTVCEEGTDTTYTNGEVLIFSNKGDAKIWDYLEAIEVEYIEFKKGNRPQWRQFGFQQCMNDKASDWMFMDVLPIKQQIQGHVHPFPSRSPWTPNHIMAHALNSYTGYSKKQRLQEFIEFNKLEDIL